MENQREINKKIAEKNQEILDMLKRIENSLYSTADNNNWGHVGDTEHVRENLKEICDFFCI